MLHTVNKSPFDRNSLESCLRFAHQGHSILLFEDGVYGALKGTRFETLLTEALKSYNIYVLVPDIEARGMRTDGIIEGIKPTDYAGFVDLVAQTKAVQAWL
ncbi:MAG TPA: sulfurtransferase complex subunit TusB [Beggiatoa sp.]|nr:MAG: sulfurtransferase TusB [Beggiatoa sp. 4572_84]RKZ63317.1 MAG: sulfurtransferase complex subunit TusB [Gammaproteobacteria bacterium]HEW98252.1 sulfurtransferase complex subunit TusB [Beggiatoa sp.]